MQALHEDDERDEDEEDPRPATRRFSMCAISKRSEEEDNDKFALMSEKCDVPYKAAGRERDDDPPGRDPPDSLLDRTMVLWLNTRRDRTSLHRSTRRGCDRVPPSSREFSRRHSGAPCMSPGTCRGRRPRGWPRWRGRRRWPRSCTSFRRPEAAARCCNPCGRSHVSQTPPTSKTGLPTRCTKEGTRRRQAIRRGREEEPWAERPCGAECQASGRPTLAMCTLASGRLAARSFNFAVASHFSGSFTL